MTGTAYTSISLPVELAEKIKRRIEGSGFTSLSGYATFVLREVLGQEPDERHNATEAVTNLEKREVLKRLKNLGYI